MFSILFRLAYNESTTAMALSVTRSQMRGRMLTYLGKRYKADYNRGLRVSRLRTCALLPKLRAQRPPMNTVRGPTLEAALGPRAGAN